MLMVFAARGREGELATRAQINLSVYRNEVLSAVRKKGELVKQNCSLGRGNAQDCPWHSGNADIPFNAS